MPEQLHERYGATIGRSWGKPPRRPIGAPTDILIEIEQSDGGGTWYKYMTGPFGDLRYVSGAGDKKECIDGEVRAHYFRVKVTATGTTAADTFTLSLRVEFASM